MLTRKTQAYTLISMSLNSTPLLCPTMTDGDICCWVNTTLLKWSGSWRQAAKQYVRPGTAGMYCVRTCTLIKGLSSFPGLFYVILSHWERYFQMNSFNFLQFFPKYSHKTLLKKGTCSGHSFCKSLQKWLHLFFVFKLIVKLHNTFKIFLTFCTQNAKTAKPTTQEVSLNVYLL